MSSSVLKQFHWQHSCFMVIMMHAMVMMVLEPDAAKVCIWCSGLCAWALVSCQPNFKLVP